MKTEQVIDIIYQKYLDEKEQIAKSAMAHWCSTLDAQIAKRRGAEWSDWSEEKLKLFSAIVYEADRLCCRDNLPIPPDEAASFYKKIDAMQELRETEQPGRGEHETLLKYRAYVLGCECRFDKAVADLVRAEKILASQEAPEDAKKIARVGLLCDRAYCLSKLGKSSEAIECASMAKDLAEEFQFEKEAWHQAAVKYFIQGDSSTHPRCQTYFTHCDVRAVLAGESDFPEAEREFRYYWRRLQTELRAPEALPIPYLLQIATDENWKILFDDVVASCARTLYIKTASNPGTAMARYLISALAGLRARVSGNPRKVAAAVLFVAFVGGALSSGDLSLNVNISELPDTVQIDDRMLTTKEEFLEIAREENLISGEKIDLEAIVTGSGSAFPGSVQVASIASDGAIIINL